MVAETRLCFGDRRTKAMRVTVLQEQLDQSPKRAPTQTETTPQSEIFH